jgi:hypothetical protein
MADGKRSGAGRNTTKRLVTALRLPIGDGTMVQTVSLPEAPASPDSLLTAGGSSRRARFCVEVSREQAEPAVGVEDPLMADCTARPTTHASTVRQ